MRQSGHPYQSALRNAWIALLAVFILGCGQEADRSVTDSTRPSVVVSVTSAQQMADILATAGPRLVVIEFYADWCGPCRELKPIFERLARKYQGRYIATKVDIDHVRDLANQYRVAGIPNVILIKQGRIVQKFRGLYSQDSYEEALLNHMGDT